MKQHYLALLIGILLVGTINGQTPPPAAPAAPVGGDEAAIRAIVQKIEDSWNQHDGKAFAAPFAEDADYVVVSGLYIKGRAVIESGHTRIFNTIYKESRNKATIKSLRFLRPDFALVHVEWNLEFKTEGEARKSRAMNSMLLTKEKDQWSIVAFQNTPIDLPPAPPPSK